MLGSATVKFAERNRSAIDAMLGGTLVKFADQHKSAIDAMLGSATVKFAERNRSAIDAMVRSAMRDPLFGLGSEGASADAASATSRQQRDYLSLNDPVGQALLLSWIFTIAFAICVHFYLEHPRAAHYALDATAIGGIAWWITRQVRRRLP